MSKVFLIIYLFHLDKDNTIQSEKDLNILNLNSEINTNVIDDIEEKEIQNDLSNNSLYSLIGENLIKKKLFSKKDYPLFYYDKKNKLTEYGIVNNFK
jgi:hypothetical protein